MIRPSSTSSALVRVILRGGSSSSRHAASRPLPSSSYSGGGRCSLLLTTNGVNATAMELRSNRDRRLFLLSTRQFSSSTESLSSKHKDEQIRKTILSAALHHVQDMGWTDDAIASGVLDCNYPPSYIGRVLSSTSSKSSSVSSSSDNNNNNDYSSSGVWGNGQLVAHFMEECNNDLRDQLMSLQQPSATASSRKGQVETNNNDVMVLASHINTALQLRLSMVIPYINSQRWHEGMAIGALPQNALMTMSQLNDMADIVLSYAKTTTIGGEGRRGRNNNNNSVHKMSIIAAYAAAELHLLSSNVTSTSSSTTTSLSGDRHNDTWTFLEARSSEAAHVIIHGGMFPSFDLPVASTIQTASAITSSLLGAALSLASPNTASMVGRVGRGSSTVIVPQVLDSVLGLVQSYVGIGTTTMTNGVVSVDGMMKRGDAIANGVGGNTRKGDGTRPSDYAAIEESLPPFDTTEEIFGSIKKKI